MKQEIIRKLSAAVAMSLVVGVSLAACGGSSSSTAAGVTKTGSAEGFGGAVTATLTVDANGTVTDCKLEGAQETESIGGAALEELSKQVVAANGPAIDGVAGATMLCLLLQRRLEERFASCTSCTSLPTILSIFIIRKVNI